MFNFKTGKQHTHGTAIGFLFIFPSLMMIIPIIFFFSSEIKDVVVYFVFPTGIALSFYMYYTTWKLFLNCPRCKAIGFKKTFFEFSNMEDFKNG